MWIRRGSFMLPRTTNSVCMQHLHGAINHFHTKQQWDDHVASRRILISTVNSGRITSGEMIRGICQQWKDHSASSLHPNLPFFFFIPTINNGRRVTAASIPASMPRILGCFSRSTISLTRTVRPTCPLRSVLLGPPLPGIPIYALCSVWIRHDAFAVLRPANIVCFALKPIYLPVLMKIKTAHQVVKAADLSAAHPLTRRGTWYQRQESLWRPQMSCVQFSHGIITHFSPKINKGRLVSWSHPRPD
jgi:hypothetical protein